jgi:hypothetical protein
VRPRVLCCWIFWPLTGVTQSGGRKLTCIVMVEIRNMHVEYDHCAVKETYENILNNVVKFSNGV